jgi:hypothetical protein
VIRSEPERQRRQKFPSGNPLCGVGITSRSGPASAISAAEVRREHRAMPKRLFPELIVISGMGAADRPVGGTAVFGGIDEGEQEWAASTR